MSHVRRWARDDSRIVLAALAIMALAAGILRMRPAADPDLPWHLDQAEAVLRAGAWRYLDDTSFTVPGAEYVNHPWLGGLLLLALFRAFGWSGPVMLAAACAALSTLLAGLVARRAAASRPWLAVAVAALVAGATSWRFDPRPHCLYLVLLPWAMLLADSFARAEERREAAWRAAGLALLGLVWAQLHASYVVLSPLVAIALLGQMRARGLANARRLALPVVLLGLVFVAPGGLAYFAWLADIGLGDATSYIAEMKPLSLRDMLPSGLDQALWLDALLGLALLRWGRSGRLRADDAAHALLGLALALTARRFGAAWALLLVPAAARVPAHQRGTGRRRRRDRFWGVLAAVGVPACLLVALREQDPARGFGLGMHRDFYAVDVSNLLKGAGVEGKLFNEYNDGGWLALQLAPRVTIAIDGRTPNYYDAELFFFYRLALERADVFAQLEDIYQPDLAMPFRERPLCGVLAADPRWDPSYLDDYRTLFVLADRHPELPRLRQLDPCDPNGAVERACAEGASSLPALVAELDTLIRRTPEAPFPHLLRARLELACRRDPEIAIAHIDVALAAPTHHPDAYNLSAQARAIAGRLDEASRAADRAVALDAGWSSRALRARLRLTAGDPSGALSDLEQVLEDSGDAMPGRLRLDLARALLGVGRRPEAILQARRAQLSGAGPGAAQLLRDLGAP